MKCKITLGLLITLFLSCNENKKNSWTNLVEQNNDTIVCSKTIIDEIPGSVYRKRATGYFMINGKDTSNYTCIFTESKNNNRVYIDIGFNAKNASMTYRQRFEELKIILPRAAKDYEFDSLYGIGYGQLFFCGDLAVDVTKQYIQKFGASNELQSYETVQQFFKQSKLCADIDLLLKPYSISTENVLIEKLSFTTRKTFLLVNKVEGDSSNIPDRILECDIGVGLKKNKK